MQTVRARSRNLSMWVSIAVGVSLLNPNAHAGTLEKKTRNRVVNLGIDRGGFTVEMPWTVPVNLDRLTRDFMV